MKHHALLAGSRYELLVKIATGGTATVYAGRISGSVGFQRLVAIKRAHPHLRDDPRARAMLVREARLASRIHHANVVAIQDVEETDDELLLVMDYVEGASLAELLERALARDDGGLAPEVATRILLDACGGLEAVHALCDDVGRELGMVHRDVSPQNILVGIDGTARLTDFGLAKLTEVSMSSTAGMQGKIAYMAPEYVEGAAFSQRCDIFSMGVVAWETLAGQRLFRGNNDADTLRRVVTHPAPPISAVAPALPTALDAVLAKALDKDPDRRHPTMRALGAELAEALHGVAAASHAQVGSLMCSLFAVELADRRDVIRAIADPEQASTASMVHHDLPLAPTEPVIAPILVTPSSEEAPPPDVTAGDAPVRGLKRAPLLLLAVALGIIGAGLASYESDDRPRLLLDVVRVPLPFAEPVTPAPADAPSARVVIDMDAPDSAASAQPAPDTSAPEPPPIARPKPATKAGNKIPDNPYTERLR